MSEYPLSTPDDLHGYRATVMAVRNLAGRQALTLEQAWSILLQRRDGPDAMPAEARASIRELLLEFGYREYLVTPMGGQGRRALWLRPDWTVETVNEVPFS